MAKYDSHSSRITAIDQDEAKEQFYRPAAPSKSRAPRSTGFDPPRSLPVVLPDVTEDNAGEPGEDSFLRVRRRVPIRRGILPKSRTGRGILAAIVVLAAVMLVLLGISVRNFLRNDPRFRIDSASSIQIMGNSQVTRAQLLSVFGSDIGRNLFFVPLKERRVELERLPWVERATVMRLLPNQLRVSITERVPVAFIRNGDAIGLVDAHGVLLNMPPAMMQVKHYSFPVVTGITPRDPLPIRAARMHFYRQFIDDLDSGGAKVSERLSEVDISDPEDIRAVMPTEGTDILVHFGENDFLGRYQRYQQHLAEWLRQYPRLASVDMRYDSQVVLAMAKETATAPSGGDRSNAGQPKARTPQLATHVQRKPARKAVKPPRETGRNAKHNVTRSHG